MSKSTKHSHLFTTLSLAAALATTHLGCAGDIDAEQSPEESENAESVTTGLVVDDSTVVAAYRAPDGRQLIFLEPEPGFRVTMTAGRIGTIPLVSSEEVRTVRPDQLYERVSGVKAPSKLREIAQRFQPRSLLEQAKPSVQADKGAKNIGERSQALHNFSDAWLFDPANGVMACVFGYDNKIVRFGLTNRDLIHDNTVNGGQATVFNTGVEADVTGSFKFRNTFTWSRGVAYTVRPNEVLHYDIDNDGWNVKYDIKTFVRPNGSSYTACQSKNSR